MEGKHIINLSVPDTLYDRLKARSKEQNTTLRGVIMALITKEFDPKFIRRQKKEEEISAMMASYKAAEQDVIRHLKASLDTLNDLSNGADTVFRKDVIRHLDAVLSSLDDINHSLSAVQKHKK